MFDKILRLGKETAIYGLSTVVGRLLNFLIVPFYANMLLPSENGIVANIYAYIAFAFIIYCYGMEQAYMRFVSSQEENRKKVCFSVPFFSLLISSLLFSLIIHLNSVGIAKLIGIDVTYNGLIRFAAWILFFDSLAIIPFASMRMQHKAVKFALTRLFNIFVNLLLNLILILGFGMRADGVFLANLLASFLTFMILLGYVIKQIAIDFDMQLYKNILKFGLPFVPAGLAGIAMQVVDRPIVKLLTDDATLGIYQLNYRLGVFMMLIVGMFDYAWRPFFLNHANEPDAKRLFSKVFTYFVVIAMSIFILFSLFIDDLVRINIFGKQFFPPIYWQGTEIVPWILLAYVFTGAYVIFVAGLYLEKKTQYIPIFSGTGALVNIGANFLLIPKIGIMGAALSTLLSYIIMAGGIYVVSQRFYKIEYEWNKVAKVFGLSMLIFVLFKAIEPAPMEVFGFSIKILLIGIFFLGLFLLKIINVSALSEIRESFIRVILARKN